MLTRLCILLLSLLMPIVSFADSATLTWNANTESDLAGYKLYQGTVSGQYGPPVDLGNVTTYTLTLPTLTIDQTYFFAITAYDKSSNESKLSAEVNKKVAGTPPIVSQSGPSALPLQFTGTVPETFTTVVNISKPTNATAATLSIACFDCDHPDWGTLVINGNPSIAIWPGSTAANSNAIGTITIPVPLAYLVNGNNTFTFTHTNYLAGRVDAIVAHFTVPDTTAPAPPQGLSIK